MIISNTFDGLAEFLAIARRGSIRGAALDLGVTPGAVSQALQRLERRLGIPLFTRTTRRISLTEAGNLVLSRVGPAAMTIGTGLEEISQGGKEPSGTLRLIVERVALPHVVEPILPIFRKAWPRLKVEITVSNDHSDFISESYDAGIRIGSYVGADMIALQLLSPFRWGVFGSPIYFAEHGRPTTPAELSRHECIRYRRAEKGDLYRWEFVENGHSLRVEPQGDITVSDGSLMRSLAARGVGLIYSSTLHAAKELETGTLEPVLLNFAPPNDSLYLYFTKALQNQPKLRAFVEVCASLRRGQLATNDPQARPSIA